MTRSLTTWIPFVLAFVLLTFFCIRYHSPIIHNDILDRSSQALASAGVGGSAEIKVDGLDVTLKGEVATDAIRLKAEQLVSDLRGVRVVHNDLTVTTTAPQLGAVSEHEFSVTYDGREVVLTGMVLNGGVRASIVGAARQLFSDAKVTDRLQVVPSTPTEWDFVIKNTFTQMAKFKTGKFDLLNNRAALYGSVASAVIKQDAITALNDVAGDTISTKFDISVLEPTQEVIADCQSELNRLLDGQVIEFATGSDQISVDSYPLLEQVVDSINRCVGVSIEIQGHTDSAGDEAANLVLSNNRANAVLRHLADDGVDAQKLTAKGYGESRPISDNSSRAGRARNRRIEFKTLGN